MAPPFVALVGSRRRARIARLSYEFVLTVSVVCNSQRYDSFFELL